MRPAAFRELNGRKVYKVAVAITPTSG
ncbi:MAG: hypothetical protein QOF80_2625, partial [Verrucomicrobiota bacterium]